MNKKTPNPIQIKKIKEYFDQELELIPGGLNITTITITFEFKTEFNLENIGKYINLSYDGIAAIKYGSEADCNRTIIPEKRVGRKSKKKRNNFYNQTSLTVLPDGYSDSKKLRKINIKLFGNGSIQMAGCKNSSDFVKALTIICDKLTQIKGIYNRKNGGKIITKPFTTKPDNINPNTGINTIPSNANGVCITVVINDMIEVCFFVNTISLNHLHDM